MIKKFILVFLASMIISGLYGCEKKASENKGVKVRANISAGNNWG